MEETRPLKLQLARRALKQLHSIENYISARNPRGAENVLRQIRWSFELLSRHPLIGRPSRLAGKREWSVAKYPYVIVYRTVGDPPTTLRILGVFHTAQGTREL